MRISEKQILNSTNVSSTLNSEAYQIEHLLGFSIALKYTPTNDNFSGKILIQASNDESNWCNITTTDINHSDSSYIYNISEAYYKYVRVQVQIITSTISSITATIYSKGW